jgi:hypothetical protein
VAGETVWENNVSLTPVATVDLTYSNNSGILLIRLSLSVTRLGKILPFWAIFTLAWAIFTQISSLKTWFVILILTFKSSLMQLFWTFNLSFDILATVLATLPNIG